MKLIAFFLYDILSNSFELLINLSTVYLFIFKLLLGVQKTLPKFATFDN